MIIVKTKMKRMPEACSKCPFYMAEWDGIDFYWPGICKVISETLPKGLQPTKERWKKCPLMEVED